jgi:flagellar biosynthesis/type III secretory pathway M-ring protein FliF/YscJ
MNARPYHEDPPPPKTDTIVKTAKKSFINWVVPALCLAVSLAVFTVVKSWADDRYTQKKDADAVQLVVTRQIDEERQKRESLEREQSEMNRKLDLIVYILQNSGKVDPKTLPPGP